MREKLIQIFNGTRNVHFDEGLQISYPDYLERFKSILDEEQSFLSGIDQSDSNLSMYMSLSIMVMAIIKIHEDQGIPEEEIGKTIYNIAQEYFKLSPLSRFIKNKLFFSPLNLKAIRKRERKTQETEKGLNGFKLRLSPESSKDGFTVIYEECGICKYYKSKGLEKYIKYCCLVDYCIMSNLGISFTRKGTIGNGAERCDFNFHKTGPLTNGWPPYDLEEFKI